MKNERNGINARYLLEKKDILIFDQLLIILQFGKIVLKKLQNVPKTSFQNVSLNHCQNFNQNGRSPKEKMIKMKKNIR